MKPLLFAVLLLCSLSVFGQRNQFVSPSGMQVTNRVAVGVQSSATLPSTCTYGAGNVSLYYKTGSSNGFYTCNTAGTGWDGPYQSSAGGGTVTSVSVTTANGLSGTVATATTTPAITLSVGAISLATATGLPVSTGISGLGTGVATFLATPSSANLASAVTNETGSGALVFGTSPTFTTQILLPSGSSSTLGFKIGSTGCYERVAGVFNCLQESTTPAIDFRPAFGEIWVANTGGGFGLVNSNDVTSAAAAAGMTLCTSSTQICFGNGSAGSFNNTIKTTNANFQGSLIIGGGTAILKHLSSTATLDFANLAAIGCEDLTITVTGAALGDTVALGVPNASMVANGTFFGWVSAADTVSVRFCTVVSGNPASGSFRADIWQH
jgi:hypothetical protein